MTDTDDRPDGTSGDEAGRLPDDTTDELPPPAAPGEPATAATPVFTQADVDARVEAATAETRDRHLRLAAEYENFRRRVQREKEQWTSEAVERFATDLLGVLDDFDRALAAAAGATDAVTEGIRLTEKQLRATLARHGVECVDPVGAPFDPKLHEAIQRVPSGDRAPGTVVQVLAKGYTLKGRLLRPARVQVAG
jgi:molecular chaperone GrpE